MRKKSFRETETTYNNINDDILSHKYKILISNDAKGWSDVGPRCAWAKHHDYVFQTIKNAPNVKLENLWKNTRATINKRGYVNSFSATATMFQGFTGTMDSLLNDRITLFTVREARKLGLLGKGGYVRTAALIDDAIQAIFMAKETTLKDAQRLADQQFDITATVWKKLGAELDDVKTMISDNAFVYLNRFFCEGTEVLTPMKVYSKADREFTRRYATIVESIDTILGSYRAAVGRGGDPLVCYKMCIYKSVRLMLKTNHEMMYICMSKFINTCFAPRGLGGMGLPVMTAFLTNECKDNLTSYLAAMCMTSNVMRTERWARVLLETTTAVIEQKFEKNKYSSLACNPRGILADGVPDPGSAVRGVLKKSLLNFAESPIFREVLSAASCDAQFYEFITKSGIWDANVLEAFAACLPNRVESALLARASESEILVKVCSYRERRYMGRVLRERNRDLVGHIKRLQFKKRGNDVSILSERSCSTDVATHLRDAYYHSLDVNIVNHTLPAYASCYARIDTADKPMFTIVSTKPTSRCSDLKSTSKNAYANWYDGRSKDGQRRPVKSSSAKIAHSPQYKLLSIAQKCIADGAALVGYVKDSLVAYPDDRSAECLWLLFCAGWMIEDINNAPDLGVSYKADAATKRIGIKTNVLNHLLLPFPNARDCVTVDALPLMRYVDAIKTNIHAYAMIDCLKATMLIEAACSNESGHNLLFNLQSDALSLRSNITYEVDISLDFGILNRIKPKGNNVYKSLAMASVRLKIGGTCDDDEGIDFWISSRITPQDLGGSMGVIIRPGIITGDIMAPGTATKQYTTRHTSALIDEETFCKRSNIRTRIDKYMQTMDPNIALLTAMTDQVATELPVMCPNALMECTWETCVGIVNELLPSATSVIQRAFKSINMYKRHFRIVVLEPIFRRCPINELNAFKSPAKVDKLKIPHIVAHFTMFAYGRFPNSAMYSSAISKGAKHIRTIYKNRSMRKFARSRNVGDENHTLGILFRLLATHAAMPRTGKDAITSIMSCFADALDLSLLVQGKEAHDNASIKNVTGKEMHQTIEGAADLRILCLTVKLHATRVIDTSTGIFLSHALNMVVANYRSLVDGMIKRISTGVTEVYTVDEKFTSSVPGIEGEIVFKDCEVTTNVDNQWKQAVMSLAADLDYDAVRQVISTHTYDTNMILPIFNEEEFQEAISMVLR